MAAAEVSPGGHGGDVCGRCAAAARGRNVAYASVAIPHAGARRRVTRRRTGGAR